MLTHRASATVAGILYIIGTVAGFLSLIVTGGILGAPDYLSVVASKASQTMLGAFLILVMGLALAMVPVVVFPVLRRHNEVLAIGYVVFRGALETAAYVGSVICWLLLVVVAGQSAGSGSAAASQLSSLGILLVKAQDPIGAVTAIVFSLGALMLYYVLYQARLLPRWISGWGIVAGVAYLTAGLLSLFSIGTDQMPLMLPMLLQEMVMAVWLIVKGFNPSAVAVGSAEQIHQRRVAAEA